MTRLKKFIGLFLPALMLMAIMAGTVQAALLDFGPIVPEVEGSTPPNLRTGFPLWFRDSNRVPLQLCLEEVPGCLFAAVDRPNLNQPLAFPNIPDELFYYSATALIPNANAQLNDHLLFAGVEMNFFDNGDGTYEQVGFARIRIRIDSTVPGNYTVTTPWKQFLFTVDQATIDANAGRRVINATEDIGLGPDGVFDGVLLGSIGTFAYSQGAPFVTLTGSYLGDNTPRTLVGSPFTDPVTGQPANIFRIDGPGGFTTVSTDQFAVTGKLLITEPTPTPLTVDKLTYVRDAAGVQVNAFATTQALSNQTNPAAAFPQNFALTGAPSTLQLSGTGLPTPLLTTNSPGDGKFFTNTDVFALQNLPTEAKITNTADVPPTEKTVPLVDQVVMNKADFNPLTNTLSVAAVTYDRVDNPALQVFIPGNNTPLGTLADGQFDVTFPVTVGLVTYNIPPLNVTVKSANLGSVTAPVSVVIPAPDLTAALIISPVNASTLTGTTQTFTWNDVGANFYQLRVGTTPGGFEYGLLPVGAGETSATISGLPTGSVPLVVTLYSVYGNGLFATNTKNYTSAPGPAAEISAPAAGGILSTTQTFTWNDVGANFYQLRVGTTPNGFEYGLLPVGAGSTSATISGLPMGSVPVVVTLYSVYGNGLFTTSSKNYTTLPIPAAYISSPATGGTLATTQTFTWNDVGADFYQLRVGTTPNGFEHGLLAVGAGETSATLSGLPTGNVPLVVTLYSFFGPNKQFGISTKNVISAP